MLHRDRVPHIYVFIATSVGLQMQIVCVHLYTAEFRGITEQKFPTVNCTRNNSVQLGTNWSQGLGEKGRKNNNSSLGLTVAGARGNVR